jgi:hypothetical protein
LATHMDQFHNHFRYEFNRVYTVRRDFPHKSSGDKDVRADLRVARRWRFPQGGHVSSTFPARGPTALPPPRHAPQNSAWRAAYLLYNYPLRIPRRLPVTSLVARVVLSCFPNLFLTPASPPPVPASPKHETLLTPAKGRSLHLPHPRQEDAPIQGWRARTGPPPPLAQGHPRRAGQV